MPRWRPPQGPSTALITRGGFERLKAELDELWRVRRPEVVKALAAAAAEGDRSENAEYTYRKKQLGEIDRRVRYLSKRIEGLKVVDGRPADPRAVFFGAWLTVEREDTGVDLTGYFARQAGNALGNALGAELATGNGSSKPSGVVQTSTLGVTGDASVVGVPTAANLIDLYYSVISPYRNSSSCVWLFRDSTAAKIRKLVDNSGGAGVGNYLWTPGLGEAPDTILGKRVVIEPNIAATALSAKSVVFGDMSRYFVRIAGGVRFERSDEFAFQNDLVTFRAILRGDGVLGDQTGAVKHYIGNAA